jgi:hypothetical protein
VGGHYWQDEGSKGFIVARDEYYATHWKNATLANVATRTATGTETRSWHIDAEATYALICHERFLILKSILTWSNIKC